MVLASYGELPDEQAIVLERHLQDCAICRQELADVQGMFATLETRPVIDLNPNFLAQSRMRLDEALDQIPSHSFLAQSPHELLPLGRKYPERARTGDASAWSRVSGRQLCPPLPGRAHPEA